jgi:hypothetical protein
MHSLLAFQLAIWSPVMCCCAIKGAIGAVTGVEHVGCQIESCCAPLAQVEEQPSCCDGTETIHSANRSQHSTDDCNCRCDERASEKVQLDTGGKIHVPSLQIAFVFVHVLLVATPTAYQSAAMGDLRQRPHPPPHTLLSQRCLLLI